jgi:hypothetical protein
MSDKNYSQRTKVLGIPVVGYGDKIWPEVELRKWQIVENMLLAGTQGVKNCLFTEGDLMLESNPEGGFIVILRATAASTAATGVVSGSFFRAPAVLKWDGLVSGKLYYLYLVGSPKTFAEHSLVRTMVSEFEQKNKQAILMGVADLRGAPTLERYPNGKVYASDLGSHISDGENPHGETLVQDEMIVRKRLVLGDDGMAEIQIRIGSERLTMPASLLVPRVVDFESKGKEGVAVTVDGRVAFVQVSRMSGGTGISGEISVGYFGKDNKVSDSKSFCVYNDGDTGIPMRAIVFFG